MQVTNALLALFISFTASGALADEQILGTESDNQTQDQANAQFDNQVYRGGNSAALVDPWAVPSPNLDNSQMLEEQMNPKPTIEYDQQLNGLE